MGFEQHALTRGRRNSLVGVSPYPLVRWDGGMWGNLLAFRLEAITSGARGSQNPIAVPRRSGA